MSLQLVTAPASGALPVTVDELKRFASITGTDRDTLLGELLQAAVALIEELLGRALATQTWQLGLDAFAEEIVLPLGPVQSIEAIKYYDAAKVEQTLSAETYILDMVSDPARIVVADGRSWPVPGNYPTPIRIRFITGYAVAAEVPAPIKTAIKMTALSLFENRSAGDVPVAAMRMLEPWRSGWFAS